MNVLIRRRDAYLLLSQDLIAQLVQVVEFLVEAEYAKFNGEFVVEVPLGSERAYCCPPWHVQRHYEARAGLYRM